MGARMDTILTVNGREHRLSLDRHMTSLDTLRERFGLTGAKKDCDQGQCGSGTVLVGGDHMLACFALAAAVDGEVTTSKGWAAKIGIVSVNAAVANAVHHATGRHIRQLPIRMEALL